MSRTLRSTRRMLVTAVAAAAAMLALGAAAGGASPSPALVTARDDCDPATFSPPPPDGPGIPCVGDGDTTFGDLVQQLITTGSAEKWRFSASKLGLKPGRALVFRNDGGEAHSFTEVAAYGPGCVKDVNDLIGLTGSVPECGDLAAFPGTIRGPGETRTVGALAKGTHRFECLIHPWMRTTVTVR